MWAGLKMLLPKPPKTCLPITMAQKVPKIASTGEKPGGRHKASSKPVNKALPSVTVIVRPIIFWQTASKKIAERQQAKMTVKASSRKNQTAARIVGANANNTSRMAALTVSPQWMCGDDETISMGAGFLIGSIRKVPFSEANINYYVSFFYHKYSFMPGIKGYVRRYRRS